MIFIAIVLICFFAMAIGCSTPAEKESSNSFRLQIGHTTKEEVLANLGNPGPAHESLPDGREKWRYSVRNLLDLGGPFIPASLYRREELIVIFQGEQLIECTYKFVYSDRKLLGKHREYTAKCRR